jgi:hypothetical protein
MPRTEPIAPRWAAWTAAVLDAEYAVSKVVMAARGELGVVGHPAPPEAYEHFTGDVVAAQLGNAGLGMLGVALALALGHRWGRRIPAWLLAAGSLALLAAGIAGALVVGGSLLGLRDDHGQWGIDSLVLSVPALAAWVVLTVAAVRAAGMPGRVAALGASVAGAGCLLYGALKLSWALGGELLMRETPLPADARRDMLAREPVWVAGHWVSVGLAAAGIGVAVATVRARGLARPLTVWLPALIGALMLARAAWGAGSDLAVLTGAAGGVTRTARWDLLLWSPFFAAWGASWLLAARASRRCSSVWLRNGLGSHRPRAGTRGEP